MAPHDFPFRIRRTIGRALGWPVFNRAPHYQALTIAPAREPRGLPVVLARVRPLPNTTWGYYGASKITAQPPPSPLNCTRAQCGAAQTVRLVPFGSTNIRVSVMPWVVA